MVDKKKEPKPVQLARIFDPEQGALPLYVQAFIDYFSHDDRFKRSVARRHITPWRDHEKPDLTSYRLRGVFHHSFDPQKAVPVSGYYDSGRPDTQNYHDFGLNGELSKIIQQMKRHFFGGGYFSVPEKAHYNEITGHLLEMSVQNQAQQAFMGLPGFIRDTATIISETIITFRQSMRWACMNCQRPDDVLAYMKRMIEPSIDDPVRNRRIAPIEMLGYANNGLIGGYINGDFPILIDGEPIIPDDPHTDGPFIHPKFVELWFSQKLDIGGCPALMRQRQTPIYMDFAKMWVECAEILAARKNEVTCERAAKNERRLAP